MGTKSSPLERLSDTLRFSSDMSLFFFVRSRQAHSVFVRGAPFARTDIGSNWKNKRLHLDERVGVVSLPGERATDTSSLGGGSHPNPTCGRGGGGGIGAGGESGSPTVVAAGSSSSADVAAL